MWQLKWFRVGVLIISGLLAVGVTFILIFIHEKSFSQSPAPNLNLSSTPLPSLQGQLPEPKTLGVATKNESDVAILMYHHVQDLPPNADPTAKNLFLSPAKFKEEIKYLSDMGYKTATLPELFDDVTDKRVVLTFDDGYKDLITNVFPVLKNYGFRAVAFIIVDDVGKSGYITWDNLQKLRDEGWEIGSHSLTHPDLSRESAAVQEKQIFDSKKILEEKLNIKVEYFCYPAGKYNDTALSLVKSAGYIGGVTTDSGTKNLKTDIFVLKRIRIPSTETLAGFKSIINPVK